MDIKYQFAGIPFDFNGHIEGTFLSLREFLCRHSMSNCMSLKTHRCYANMLVQQDTCSKGRHSWCNCPGVSSCDEASRSSDSAKKESGEPGRDRLYCESIDL